MVKWSFSGRSLYFENTRKNLKVKSRTRSRPPSLNLKVSNYYLRYLHCTAEPRFNEPLYNDVLGMTNDFLQPGRRCNKMYRTELRFYEILVITNTIKKRNVKYNMSTCDRKIAKDECETGLQLWTETIVSHTKSLLQKLFTSWNAGRWKLIINYISI